MAYLTNLLVQAVSRVNGAAVNVGVMLNNGGGGSNIYSGNAAGGYYQFTGLNAGLYDVVILAPNGTFTTSNYAINNAYLIPVDESSMAEESRTYIRSQETIIGAGVLAENFSAPTGTPGPVGYTPETRMLTWPVPSGSSGTLVETYSVPVGIAKQSGNSYYHGNQNTTFWQRLRVSV